MSSSFKNKLINGDSLKELKKIPDETFDLIFADPPYNLQLKNELTRRALSAGWKQKRRETTVPIFSKAFAKYFMSRICIKNLDTDKELVDLHKYFSEKKVLRP